ncbi:hypothetical protein TrST_g6635 [Triparma strigata]|uniref:Uncharacterized protein n=1 Tax=Triparma strigata TaxID=1606541 RepID=A0A9W7AKI2_9STRA|nr:hypothetical protein TrST_g6635 [Triparma strigata]
MGNSLQGGGATAISKLEQKTQHLIVQKYEEICSKMDEKDFEAREQLEPNCLALSSYWVQMLICLVESPIHIVYHLAVYAVLCVVYSIILLVLAVLDAVIYSVKEFVTCCSRCKDCCCRKGDNDNGEMGSEMVVHSKHQQQQAQTEGDDDVHNISAAETVEMAAAASGTNHFALFMAPLTCFGAFFICLGRSMAHHYFFLYHYWLNVGYILQVLIFPCSVERSNYLYNDIWIPLKRPPRPVFMRVKVGGSGGGGDCCDCNCDCTHCFDQCELSCNRICERIADALSPVGSARRSPMRLTRSMYLGFSLFNPCHPSLVCGPLCDCCRSLYNDYDARGTLWEQERDEKQRTLTKDFFRLEYGGVESFDAIVKDIQQLALIEERAMDELQVTDKAEMMERGDKDGNGSEGEENVGILKRGWRGAMGLTYGAISLGVNVTLAPARLTARGVNYVLGGGESATNQGRGDDDLNMHDEEGWEAIVEDTNISMRALRLVREGSGGKKRELEAKIDKTT